MFSMQGIPFAPGKSPFRCKGLLYVETLEFLDKQLRGGRKAVLARVQEPELRGFLDSPFVVGGWYDLFPLLALYGTASVTMAQPFLDVVRTVSRLTVPQHYNALYRFVLKMASPEMMMRNLPRLGNAYFEFVKVSVEEVRPKTFISRSSGVPAIAAPAYMAVAEIGVLHALELSGAKKLRHRVLPQVSEGQKHGMDIVTVQREVVWE